MGFVGDTVIQSLLFQRLILEAAFLVRIQEGQRLSGLDPQPHLAPPVAGAPGV